MHKRMHHHLRDGLDFKELEPHPTHFLEELLDNYHGSNEQRAAKRQRVEEIATGYLHRGRLPNLLSTRLRGPFNGSWKNPWGETRAGHAAQKAIRITRGGSASPVTCSKAKNKGDEEKGEEGGSRKVEVISRSDEGITHGHPAEDLPTARTTSWTHVDHSRVNESFYTHTERQSPPRTHGNGRQWLKRRMEHFEEGHAELLGQNDSGEPHTPSRRGRVLVYDRSNEEPLLEPANAPENTRSNISPACPKERTLDHQWKSSASASMVISSPQMEIPSETTIWASVNQAPSSRSRVMYQFRHSDIQAAQSQHDEQAQGRNHSPLHMQAESTITSDESHWSSRVAQRIVTQGLVGGEARDDPFSREEIRRHAEKCAIDKNPSTEKPKKKLAHTKTKESLAQKPHNDYPLRPSPASSSGFSYRKTGDHKGRKTAKATQKPRPRLVNFDSSPAPNKDSLDASRDDPRGTSQPRDIPLRTEQDTNINSPDGGHSQTQRPDVCHRLTNSPSMAGNAGYEDQHESLGSSRQSLYSTQAAMMLAQLEFQQGTFPSLYSDTPLPQVESEDGNPDGTPRAKPDDERVAITPFHAFNAELDKRHPDSGPCGLPISTQDLFMAASPFAFSTVKKKATAPSHRSSLRFSVFPNRGEGEERASVGSGKSPIPSAERVPLKVRNSRVSFKSASAKGSQESSLPSPIRSQRAVESPQPDFSPRLDGDLSFTAQFLQNLDELT